VLERELVRVLERPVLNGLHAAQREEEQDRLLQPFVHDDLVGHGVDFCHARLPGVEQVDRLLDECRRVGVGRCELVATLPQLLDARLQISHGSP